MDTENSAQRIREKLLRLCEGWLDAFGERQLCDPDGPGATQDFRRIAQTCMDLGVLEGAAAQAVEIFVRSGEEYGV